MAFDSPYWLQLNLTKLTVAHFIVSKINRRLDYPKCTRCCGGGVCPGRYALVCSVPRTKGECECVFGFVTAWCRSTIQIKLNYETIIIILVIVCASSEHLIAHTSIDSTLGPTGFPLLLHRITIITSSTCAVLPLYLRYMRFSHSLRRMLNAICLLYGNVNDLSLSLRTCAMHNSYVCHYHTQQSVGCANRRLTYKRLYAFSANEYMRSCDCCYLCCSQKHQAAEKS